MTRSETSAFDLEVRHGVAQLKSDEFGMTVVFYICIAGHVASLIGLSLILIAMLGGFAELFEHGSLQIIAITVAMLTGLGTIAAVLFNRPAMFCAIGRLTAIEAVLSGCRTRRVRGWKGLFFDLFPFSVLMPPGDLLAVVLLLLLIRCDTDHLEGRPAVVFQWSEVCLGFGSVIQYVGLAVLVTLPVLSEFGLSDTGAIGIGIVWHLIMLIGVYTVSRSLQSMRREMSREIGGFVRQAHGNTDPATSFLAGLSADQVADGDQPPTSQASP